MVRRNSLALAVLLLLNFFLPTPSHAQTAAAAITAAAVPRLVNLPGRALDAHGKPLRGALGITFAIYRDQDSVSPLWMETQTVTADSTGHYSVQLGATNSQGLPLEVFNSGEARWLGVQVSGQAEQPRVVLLSVPYALKAADAETLGGFPPSAFVLAAPVNTGTTSLPAQSTPSGQADSTAAPPAAVTGSGTLNFLPIWTGAATIGNSVLFQSGTGATAKVGIGTTTPASTLDVKGTGIIRGALSLPATGTATAAGGKNSQPQNFVASAFNSGSSTATTETFRWQAEPTGNNTVNTSGSMNLLFGQGTTAPAETGFKIAGNGKITFAPGQTFPGTGAVSSVGFSAPGSDFTVSGSPITTSGTLALNWSVAPSSVNTANAIVKRDASGGFTTGVVTATTASTSYALGGINTGSGPSPLPIGVYGESPAYGVEGKSLPGGTGVIGFGAGGVAGYGTYSGVNGQGDTYGIYGNGAYGVYGFGQTYGVYGETPSGFDGVHGVSHGPATTGVAAINDGGGDAIYAAVTNGGFAGFFFGDVAVDGNLSKAAGSFKIDHPLDPANKYLYHSFVESPDMKNIYDGNITTDAEGNAVVQMPDWFEALNRDFRYQLTVIGEFAQAIVSRKISNNSFAIRTSKPNVEVSWQVTGIRQDAWANAHRIPTEQDKPDAERGSYLHPELFGAPKEKSRAWVRHAGTMNAKAPGPRSDLSHPREISQTQ